MIKVLFFGQVRELLGCDEKRIPFDSASADLDGLQAVLCADGGDAWREVLQQENMIRAVNQEVASGNPPLTDGDEVAFFPPVTGG
ncbi:molybdopterin converting factor subunit 1 [Halioglobus maricola]|uniref:Molybdopterin synthase sulfur carrier subunit n=1 Tax=Halioglobus maricola TaxID=2601894 RepID=A0A5P9NJM3_9GAMM|nr:molybdopterin converting factor subunit 1 [Halioglobus maricola]QFU76031.1 molybdopterin converting factor subunit 1 [Halioglobus maricola]